MGKFLSDFKAFAMKGNIIDMAVGVIIGGAFGKIVTSLVNDIVMPAISKLTGGDGIKNLKYIVKIAKIFEKRRGREESRPLERADQITYLCTRPEPSPPASFSTSETLTRL